MADAAAKEAKEPGSNLSTHGSDALSNKIDSPKGTPRSQHTKLQKKPGKGPITKSSAPPFHIEEPGPGIFITQGARIFGTTDRHSIQALFDQVLNANPNNDNNNERKSLKQSVAMVQGIEPRTPLEGLLAVQMIGVHNLAMECLRRAFLEEQTPEGVDSNVHRAVRLLRTFTSQMEALNRNRGKVSQQMVVENVNVNEGGQAIVGPVGPQGTETTTADHDAKKNK